VPLRAYKIVRLSNVRFNEGGFVLEVLDNRIQLLLTKPCLLTNLLIDLTNAKGKDKAKD